MTPTRTVILAALGLGLGLLVGTQFGTSSEDTPSSGVRAISETDRQAYGISFITFPIDRQRDKPGKARRQAFLAYDSLVAGGDFAAIARSRSQDPTAADGGFLGFVPAYNDTAFGGALQVLRPGETSPPVLAGQAWRILKRHTFEEARALERTYRIPTHGFFVPWAGQRGAPANQTREQALALAKEAMQKLSSGMSLSEASERYGAKGRPPAVEAWIEYIADRPQTAAAYRALSSAEPRQIVGPIETGEGWGVLVRGRYLRSLCKHILIQHIRSENRSDRVSRSPEQAHKLALKALKAVQADRGAWDKTVERFSDDPGTRSSQGLMGLMSPGTIPAGFESVIYDLKPGAIYDGIVETPYGFHVLWKLN